MEPKHECKKCDECNGDIIRESEIILKETDTYCEHCKSDIVAEYSFCSNACAIKHLQGEEK